MEPPDDDAEEIRRESPRVSYDRLLRALDRVAGLVARMADDEVREWVGLALLDAIDLGDQTGLLPADEAEQRREAVRASIADLDRPPGSGGPQQAGSG
jgi:hypothetical protein